MEDVVLTFLDDTRGNTRCPGVRVYVYDSLAAYVAQGITDSNGEVAFSLPTGNYTARTHKLRFSPTEESFSVPLGGTSETFYVSTYIVGPPPDVRVCRLFANFVSFEGIPFKKFKLQIYLLPSPNPLQGVGVFEQVRTYETDEYGHVEFDIIRGARVRCSFITTPYSREFQVPDKDVENLLTLMGQSTDAFRVVR